jgi:redox-sensing transcriptional repressor
VEKGEIPRKSVYRLSIYHRCLQRLSENAVQTVSSAALAKGAGVKPSQLRKDLAYLGQFGTRGLGYPVEPLLGAIRETLGRERLQPVILVGAGNLGAALLRYPGFGKEGFEILAAFDLAPDQAAARGLGVPVLDQHRMASFIAEEGIRLAMLCVPAGQAQEAANELVAAGIGGILNFSPAMLEVPGEVVVNHVDLAMELEHLSYFVR